MSAEFFNLHILSVVDVFFLILLLHTHEKDVARWWRAISNKDKHSSNPSRQCIIHHIGIWIIYLYRSLNIYSICIFCQEQARDVVSLSWLAQCDRGEKRQDVTWGFGFAGVQKEMIKLKKSLIFPPSSSTREFIFKLHCLMLFYANVFSVLLDFLLRLIKKGDEAATTRV